MSIDFINMVSGSWAGIAIITFVVLLFKTAPYGRHSAAGWGRSIPNKWGWVLMEVPSLCIMIAFCLLSLDKGDPYVLVLQVLWIGHYFNRTVIFPLQIRTGSKTMPMAIALSGFVFNVINAGLNGYYLWYISGYGIVWFYSWQFYVGLFLFAMGTIINLKADQILISLRKTEAKGYSIPGGWPFRWVSCPNYLGEIIEWMGFAIMAWNLPALSFFIWTFANLVPRAMDHHRWYVREFKNYPKNRKAVFPYIL